MEYKVYEVTERTTGTGKRVKSVVLQEEGKQYPYKNVSVWEDFPNFDEIAAGKTVNGDLVEKDSDKVNPSSGKPYKNRTLYPSKNANGTEKPTQVGTAELKNAIMLKLVPLMEELLKEMKIANARAKMLNDEIDNSEDVPF